jgi:hypothetical protein
MHTNKKNTENVFISKTECKKTGLYRFIDCDGDEYSSFLIEKKNMNLETVINECKLGNKKIYLKKGDKFPLCTNCNSIAKWEYLGEKKLLKKKSAINRKKS